MVYILFISTTESILCGPLNVLSEEFISNNNLYIAYGDLNCNWFKHNTLSDLCEILGMVNAIEQPTCFKGDNHTLVDVFLTNRPKCFSGVCNTDLGKSDFHNSIYVSSKMFAPSHSKHKITYRSMKHFSESAFQNNVDSIPFHVCDIVDDIDGVYWMHDTLFMAVLDKHAPVKTKTVNTQVPYMNSTLKKAINQRNIWRSKHFRNRNDKQLRMKYVMWRNHVVKLHKNSNKNYLTHRCNDNVGSKNFYKTIKPFLSTKQSHYSGSKIVLKENDSIISDLSKVADIFNMYYESIAEYKFQSDGLDKLDFDEAIMKHASHTSISLIKHFHRYRCNQCLNIFRYWNITKLLDTTVCMLRSWNVLVIICPPLCVMYLMRVSLLVIFRVLLSGLILIPYTRRKIICAKKITSLLMYWPLFLRYLKEFYPISWWLTLCLYWIIRYLLIELVTAASTWFYNSPNFGANPLIKEMVSELWQWICQKPLIACHMDS